MKALLEAGVHFGHQTHRWDPRMKPFIFAARNGIHIIDLQQTVPLLKEAMAFVRGLASRGDSVLFVGTKKQAQESIEAEATRSGMPFVTNRWLGGTLTNFQTMEQRIDHLLRLEDRRDRGELAVLIKKEAGKLLEEIEKMNRYFGGIKAMRRLPAALFIIDPPMEQIAVAEAVGLGPLDQGQRAVLGPAEKAEDEPAGGAVLHASVSRETRADSRRARPRSGAPVGFGKYLA